MISKFMWNCVLNTISKCCVFGVHSTVCNNNFPYVTAFILQEAKSRHNTLINIQSYLFSPLYCTKAQAPLWLLMQQLHRFKRQYWWLLCKHKGELPSLVRTIHIIIVTIMFSLGKISYQFKLLGQRVVYHDIKIGVIKFESYLHSTSHLKLKKNPCNSTLFLQIVLMTT